MRVGQIITIGVAGTKGIVTFIDDLVIDIDWLKEGGTSRHGGAIRYDLSHMENLIEQGTLYISDELPSDNPNLLFKKGK